jgi:hypothetical protein
VQRIITNEYYAGITTFGRYKTLDKKRVAIPPSQWVRGKGQHQPVYDEATYLDILNELDRRSAQRTRTSVYALSGLLTCAQCGERLHRHGKLLYPVYLDCGSGLAHVQIEYRLALKLVSQKVTSALQKLQDEPFSDLQATESLTAEIRQLEADRTLMQEGYAARIYTQAEAGERIVAIETEMDKLTRKQSRATQHHQQRQALHTLAQQDLSHFAHWLQHDDPATVNHLLTALCETITITKNYDLQITWR